METTRITVFCKLCNILVSCKTIQQLNTAKRFIEQCGRKRMVSEKMYEHLLNGLTEQTKIIYKENK